MEAPFVGVVVIAVVSVIVLLKLYEKL